MRVVHLWHHIGLGGIETFLCPLLNELQALGLDVAWAYHYFHDPTAEAVIRSTGVPLHHLTGPWEPYPLRLTTYRRHLRRLQADLVHVHGLVGTAAVAARLARPKGLLLHHHAPAPLRPAGLTTRLVHRLHAPIVRSVDLVLACSDAAAAEVRETFGLSTAEVRGFHSGIDLTPYKREVPAPPHPALARQADEVLLLFVGRLVPSKGVDLVLDALHLLPPSLQWRFIVVGGGPRLPSLQAQARTLGLADRVTFTGRLEGSVGAPPGQTAASPHLHGAHAAGAVPPLGRPAVRFVPALHRPCHVCLRGGSQGPRRPARASATPDERHPQRR
jgi:glycosyltransferase involved in cell wall biosynthesis